MIFSLSSLSISLVINYIIIKIIGDLLYIIY